MVNAGRKYLGVESLIGKVFVSSGLRGMSGAQTKAAYICGAICIVAEVSPAAIKKRHAQNWVMEVYSDLNELFVRVRVAIKEKKPLSIAYQEDTTAINALSARGMKLWDYINSFPLEASRAKADIIKPGTDGKEFIYPFYVQDIMGDIFSLVLVIPLEITDRIAKELIEN
ncbi:hypothetical protein ACTFIY_008353 [Dictyostelium cf. discoideum]